MNNKGFTVIEMQAALAIIIISFMVTFTIPKDLAILNKNIMNTSNKINIFSFLQTSIMQDISIAQTGYKALSLTELEINNSLYEFLEDGLYRTNKDIKRKLINGKFNYKIENDILEIYDLNEFVIKFNLNFSSFVIKEGD